eukprot:4557919-Prymnesium_polylepis.2
MDTRCLPPASCRGRGRHARAAQLGRDTSGVIFLPECAQRGGAGHAASRRPPASIGDRCASGGQRGLSLSRVVHSPIVVSFAISQITSHEVL